MSVCRRTHRAQGLAGLALLVSLLLLAVPAAAPAAPLAWSDPVRVDTAGAITAVSCPATNFCAAIDTARNLLTADPADTTWAVTGTDSATPLSVSCASSSFCAVVDSGYRAMSYTNGSWGARVAPTGGSATSLNSVSCASSLFCYSGSGYTTTPRTIDGGATWEIQNNSGVNYPGSIRAVSCAPGGDATSGFCVVVDSNNAAFVSSDGGVTFLPGDRTQGVIAGASGLTSVSCTSSTACVTVDSAGKAFYYRGGVAGGSDWTAVSADPGRQLRSVSCVPGSPSNQTFCVAVDSGGYQVETSDGGATWSTPALITGTTGTAPLNSVSCVTASFCVAVDNGGNAYRGAPQAAPANTGTAPTVANLPAQVGQSTPLSCSAAGVVWTGPSPAIAYRWQRSVPASGVWADIVLNGASQTYAPVSADVDNLLRCLVTATNAGGATDASSAATAAVRAAPVPFPGVAPPAAPTVSPDPWDAASPLAALSGPAPAFETPLTLRRTRVSVTSAGRVSVTYASSAAGVLVLAATHGSPQRALAQAGTKAAAARPVTVSFVLGAQARRMLRRNGRRLTIALAARLTTPSGRVVRQTTSLALRELPSGLQRAR